MGNLYTCAVMVDGTARCWGIGLTGALGNGGEADSNVPVTVTGLTSASRLGAGGGQTCAVIGDGTARCWGSGSPGGLGDGNAWKTAPISVLGFP